MPSVLLVPERRLCVFVASFSRPLLCAPQHSLSLSMQGRSLLLQPHLSCAALSCARFDTYLLLNLYRMSLCLCSRTWMHTPPVHAAGVPHSELHQAQAMSACCSGCGVCMYDIAWKTWRLTHCSHTGAVAMPLGITSLSPLSLLPCFSVPCLCACPLDAPQIASTQAPAGDALSPAPA